MIPTDPDRAWDSGLFYASWCGIFKSYLITGATREERREILAQFDADYQAQRMPADIDGTAAGIDLAEALKRVSADRSREWLP